MINFKPKQVELIARIHGYKVKVKTNQMVVRGRMGDYHVVHIYGKQDDCRDFETFLKTEFDFNLDYVLFYHRTGWKDRWKAKWGRMD